MKKLFLVFTTLSALTLFADAPMLESTPYVKIAPQIGHGKPLMLEVGSDHCMSCQEMGRLLYKVKKAHPDYAIYFLNVGTERAAAQKLKVMMIPTQIFYDAKGNEIDRHIGVLSKEELQKRLKAYKFGG